MTDYDDFMEYEDEDIEKSENVDTDFHIVSDLQAEWALKKIKNANDEYQRLINLVNSEIEALNVKAQELERNLDSKTGYLKSKLYEYFNTVEHKETKTQSSYKLLSGSLVFKKATTKIKRPDDSKLLEILKGIDPLDTYVETIEKPKWAEFKKTLTLSDDGHVIDENGEIIESIEVEDVPGEFNVKL